MNTIIAKLNRFEEKFDEVIYTIGEALGECFVNKAFMEDVLEENRKLRKKNKKLKKKIKELKGYIED